MHEGHRKRMLGRLADGEKLQDHELLEVLLYNAIPRQNTNETAHRLLDTFGSLRDVLRADPDALCSVEGVGPQTAAYLRCVCEVCAHMSEKPLPGPRIYDFRSFGEYLMQRYADAETEVIDIYCLDAGDRIAHIRRFTSGDSEKVTVATEEVCRVVAALHPSSIVVSHNHPDGDSRPSGKDDVFTAQMQVLCSINNVKLRDHVIVSRTGTYSYFMSGRMEEIEKIYNVANLIAEKRIV